MILLLLVLDVAAVGAVTRYLARWWRATPAAAPPVAAAEDRPADRASEAETVPAIRQVAAPALTVLPRVTFVPPPRRERMSVRSMLSTA